MYCPMLYMCPYIVEDGKTQALVRLVLESPHGIGDRQKCVQYCRNIDNMKWHGSSQMEKISMGGSDQRCLRGQVAFESDLASKRIVHRVENGERAFLGEKGVS